MTAAAATSIIRGTREWAVAEINCCIGCPYGCRYCYARSAALSRGLVASAEQWSQCRLIPEEVQRQQPHYPGQVMFPAAHDITPENLTSCITVIEQLLKSGNRVLIVSKPAIACIKRLCEVFYQKRSQLLMRFTITGRSQRLLDFWEPGAPAYPERRAALSLARRSGYATSVSIEPMLDAADVPALVAELEGDVSHSIWIGMMNRIDERVQLDCPEVRQEVARIRRQQNRAAIERLYGQLRDRPLVRWKESIKQVVGLPLAEQAGLDI